MKPAKLDKADRRILSAVQNNGRMTVVELSEQVGLSQTPCLRRLRNLEAQGIIKGYTCLLYTSPSPRDATLSRMPSSA